MQNTVIDAHCDLLSYLTKPNSTINDTEEIGCALPFLKEGNVKLQTMAIFAPVEKESHLFGIKQSEIFSKLNEDNSPFYAVNKDNYQNLATNEGIGMLASIESGSAFCDENMDLKDGFKNLETIINNVGEVFYISFTHHAENRFGGGNYSTAGLKEDGKALIDYIAKKKIAIDFSHTSDALAHGILDYLSKENLDVKIIASHSNFRSVLDHPRNLPDEIAQEIINKKGLIGMNFVRSFLNNDHSEVLLEHIEKGIQLGGENALCFGADYFYFKENPDKSRLPFYHKEHENASCYPTILELINKNFGEEFGEKISSKNVVNFLSRLWNV